ncbi:unnamed protein product [Enterobius vermicularis]|uniref:Hamartin n=1 Tax=Enterobius vermicularis TaxID=51028 RepID=A0A0N4V649_ENTVE|nr:unnamed protein product [Enterobius vermicularis]
MSARTRSEIIKLIRYSESLNSKVSEDSREALRSLIDQGEAIGHLVQYYSHTQSFRALDLLCRIKEPHDSELCNRMQECFGKNPLATIILLGQIVQKAPSWLTKLCEHSLFAHLLKLLNTTSDTVIMVGGILFISSLIPHCSTLKRPLLQDLFRILLAACALLYNKKKLLEKGLDNDYLGPVHVSHLYCVIIQYFVVLYGIYPNNLLEYLRDCYTKHHDEHALSILEPVYGVVRFHPLLAKGTTDQELNRSRWSQREAHDFSADCRHMMVRPVIEGSVNVLAKASPNHSESSAVNLNVYHFPPKVPSSHSSSNYQWNDSRWNDSPSINLGVETPPGTRSTSPTAQKQNMHSSNTIASKCFLSCESSRLSFLLIFSWLVPSSGSFHSADGSEEVRRTKRDSFSRKLVDMVRGRRDGAFALVKEGNRPSLLEKLEATKEEVGDIEVIDAVIDDKSHASVGSHVEEAIDAAEAHDSPTPTLPQDSKIDEGLVASYNKTSHPPPNKRGREENLENYSVRSRSASLARENSASIIAEKPSSVFANDMHHHSFTLCKIMEHESCNLSHRAYSCPSLVKEELEGSSQNILVIDEAKKRSVPVTLPTSTLASLIEKEFPYLAFLRTLLLPDAGAFCIRLFLIEHEGAIDSDLKKEQERTRELYMEASLEHHKILKRMCLADRLPAKIYDDMSNLIQGLPLEKQREILISRLALVNQHLMYERSGRLLHAERNRRLFGRIKQQKLSDAQIITLQKELHEAQGVILNGYLKRREELVNALSGLRKKEKLALKERQESEARYREKLRQLNIEAEKSRNELEFLKLNMERIAEEKERLAKERSDLQRRCEDGEVLRKLTEAKVTVLEASRLELRKAHETNQALRDKLALNELKAKKQNAGITSVLPISGERDERAFSSQVEKLRKELRNEQNANELLRIKKAEIEEDCKAKKEKCMDLEALLERAAVVHKQQSDAAQHKYLSLLSVCQKQQTHILELCAYIEQQLGRRTPVMEGSTAPIPRGVVPEEILSFDSRGDSDSTGIFNNVVSPSEALHTSGLFGFSPVIVDELTRRESEFQSQQDEQWQES